MGDRFFELIILIMNVISLISKFIIFTTIVTVVTFYHFLFRYYEHNNKDIVEHIQNIFQNNFLWH